MFGDINTNSLRCFTNGVAGSTNWILRGGGLTDTYVNGAAIDTLTMTTFVYSSTTVGAPAGGNLDEFRVYSRALTADEVAALYTATSTCPLVQ